MTSIFPEENEDDLTIDELEKIIKAVEKDDSLKKLSNKKDNDEPSFETVELQKLLESAAVLEGEKIENSTENENNNKKPIENTQINNLEKLNSEIFNFTKNDDIDSSDDEEVKNFLERKYNEYGQDINKKLKQKDYENKESKITNEIKTFEFSSTLKKSLNKNETTTFSNSFKNSSKIDNKLTSNLKLEESQKIINNTTTNLNSNIYTDPIFGLRIINPMISSSVLIERMNGRKAIGMSTILYHIKYGDLSQDWVIAGILVDKSPVKTSKNGSSYSIWKLTDLKGDIKYFSLFLFKSAYKELWKTSIGTVLAILNPNVFDKNEQKNNIASLSIDRSSKVMIIGQSKDLGTCKAKKKNGEPCGVTVNLGDCEFCVYHVKQEFGRMSKRSELQSATSGRGLDALRNKVLGKNEVFYGGQSFTAIPARKNPKQEAKDQKRLMTLSEYFQSPNSNCNDSPTNSSINAGKNPQFGGKKEIPYSTSSTFPKSKVATSVETNTTQRLKDLERLKALKCDTNDEPPKNDIAPQINLSLSYEKNSIQGQSFSCQKIPTLSKESFSIDLNVNAKKSELAKLKALEIIKKKPIEKSNPNFIKYRGTENGKKRAIDELYEQTDVKKRKLKQEEDENARKTRIQRIIDATSSHLDLIKSRENEQIEKYFFKMENKEKLEEKMLNTFKVACKAIICKKCKYTAFSASDRCKDEKHPLKVIDAEKRFFECQDCGNRTITVHKIPKLSCKNCQSSKWKRTAMIREKKIKPSANLSIRGDEETFLGSLNSTTSLNLLVPEESA